MKLNEKMAALIVMRWKEQGRGVPSPYAQFSKTTNEKYAEAKGYLQALEQVNRILKAADKVAEGGCDPNGPCNEELCFCGIRPLQAALAAYKATQGEK